MQRPQLTLVGEEDDHDEYEHERGHELKGALVSKRAFQMKPELE